MHVHRARQQQPADEGGGEGGESGGGGGEDSDGEGGRHGEGGGGEGVGASCHVCEHTRQPTAYSHGEMSDVAARAGACSSRGVPIRLSASSDELGGPSMPSLRSLVPHGVSAGEELGSVPLAAFCENPSPAAVVFASRI